MWLTKPFFFGGGFFYDARDYWINDSPIARGNAFNQKAVDEGWYPNNEVNLANGKRVDSYDPVKGEIVSRKATNLEEIQIETFEGYLKEMQYKYDPEISTESDIIFEGSTRLPDNSKEAMREGVQHWSLLLSAIRCAIPDAI